MGNALGPCAQAGLAIQRSFFAIAKNVRMPALIRGSTRRLRRYSMPNAHSRAIADFRRGMAAFMEKQIGGSECSLTSQTELADPHPQPQNSATADTPLTAAASASCSGRQSFEFLPNHRKRTGAPVRFSTSSRVTPSASSTTSKPEGVTSIAQSSVTMK